MRPPWLLELLVGALGGGDTAFAGECSRVAGTTDRPDRVAREPQVAAKLDVLLGELVAAADEARAGVGPPNTEVSDPYGRSRKTYERTALEVWRLVIELVALLFRTPPIPPSALPRPRLPRRFPRPWARRRHRA